MPLAVGGMLKQIHTYVQNSGHYIIWASTQENLFSVFANNKGADQPAHERSPISAFVIRLLESIISKLAANKILIF